MGKVIDIYLYYISCLFEVVYYYNNNLLLLILHRLRIAGGAYRYVDDETTREYEQSHSCLSCGFFVAQVISKDCMHFTDCVYCYRKKMHSARQPYKCVKCNQISSFIGLPLE